MKSRMSWSDSAGGLAPAGSRPASWREAASRGASSGSGEALRVLGSNCGAGAGVCGGSEGRGYVAVGG